MATKHNNLGGFVFFADVFSFAASELLFGGEMDEEQPLDDECISTLQVGGIKSVLCHQSCTLPSCHD